MNPHHVIIDKEKCIGCGLCAKACASRNITINHKRANILSNNCILCGHCTAVCPKNAISISGYTTKPIAKTAEVRLKPDDVLDVIRFRRTIRHFKPMAIPPDILQQILEAGRLTHTAKNMQDVSFIVLDQEKNRLEQMAVKLFKKLRPWVALFDPMARNITIDDHFFFFNAPIVMVILAKDNTNGILAAQNMEFVAESHGLGVLFCGFFTMAAKFSPKIRAALHVPKGKHVAATLVLGYPNMTFLRSVQREALDVKYM